MISDRASRRESAASTGEGANGMSVSDDREEFAARAREQALAMGRDKGLFERCVATLADIDRYDYTYLWTWLGVPIIQLPADIMATQEVVWAARPDIIVETGVARGGSVIFLASLLQLIGKGKVIGVDIDIRPHNRRAINEHPFGKRVELIEGSSVAEPVLARVKAAIAPGSSVMVFLDSDHSYEHVLAECRAYGELVTPGQYLVVADTALGHMQAEQTPLKRSHVWVQGNEPLAAVSDYLRETRRFEVDPVINGKLVLSSSPGGYLRCIAA
jgi:cephalosporin hydroxylase